MKANEWERIRKTPEAVALRSAAVAWVAREGGEVGSDVRLLDAAIALATVASRSGESRPRCAVGDLVITVDRLEDEARKRALAAWEVTTGATLRREYGAETVRGHRRAFVAELNRTLAPIFEAMRMAVPHG